MLKTFRVLLTFACITLAMISFSAEDAGNISDYSNNNREPTAEHTAYGDTGGLSLPLVNEPVTISVVVETIYPVSSDLFVIKEIEKRTGIRLDIQDWSTPIFKDKLNITLASRNIPDIITSINRSDINTLGMNGVLAPVNEHMDILPNFRNIFVDNKENSWVLDDCTAEDGNLYFWPWYDVNRDVNHGFLFRKDIFDKHGIKEWTTTEEFYLALKQLKELYPESTPYASKTKERIFADWAFGWGLRLPMYFDEAPALWKFAPAQTEYKQMLDFMKKLYNEGLIDPDFLTSNIGSWSEKMTKENKAFVTFDWIDRMDLFYEKAQNPEYDLRYANPVGPVGKIKRLDKITGYGVCVASNPNKETALKFLDYTASPSGTKLLTMGVEGVTFIRDSSGKVIYPGLKGEKIDIGVLGQKYGLFLMGLYTRIDRESIYFDLSPRLQEAQDKMLQNNHIEDRDPYLKYTREEDSIIASLYEPLNKAAEEFSAKYILNKAYGENEWNEWLKHAESLGYKKLQKIYNEAYKRHEAELKN